MGVVKQLKRAQKKQKSNGLVAICTISLDIDGKIHITRPEKIENDTMIAVIRDTYLSIMKAEQDKRRGQLVTLT